MQNEESNLTAPPCGCLIIMISKMSSCMCMVQKSSGFTSITLSIFTVTGAIDWQFYNHCSKAVLLALLRVLISTPAVVHANEIKLTSHENSWPCQSKQMYRYCTSMRSIETNIYFHNCAIKLTWPKWKAVVLLNYRRIWAGLWDNQSHHSCLSGVPESHPGSSSSLCSTNKTDRCKICKTNYAHIENAR